MGKPTIWATERDGGSFFHGAVDELYQYNFSYDKNILFFYIYIFKKRQIFNRKLTANEVSCISDYCSN